MKTFIFSILFFVGAVISAHATETQKTETLKEPPEINDCVEKGYAIDSAGFVYEGYDIDTALHGQAVCFKQHAEQKALKKCQQQSPNPPCQIIKT